ncbi:MAG: ABC transporter substrate-binding protein [Oscillospiraceae bacterium]
MKSIIIKTLVTVIILTNLSGCLNSGGEKSDTSSNLPVEDRSGQSIEVPENIETIVSLAPSITDILINLEMGNKIVGIDSYSKTVENVSEDVEIFDLVNPDAEKLSKLNPDVIFTTNLSLFEGEAAFNTLKKLGLTIIAIPTSDSIEAIKDDIKFIGQVTKKESNSNKIVDEMEKEISKIEKIAKTITDKKNVYFEIAGAPNLYSFGKGVYLNEMIEIIGANNILADQNQWTSVEQEIVVKKNPDVIITNVDYVDDPVAEILSRDGWQNVTAVKDKAVYQIDKNTSSQPSNNVVKALSEMAKAIYPDKF